MKTGAAHEIERDRGFGVTDGPGVQPGGQVIQNHPCYGRQILLACFRDREPFDRNEFAVDDGGVLGDAVGVPTALLTVAAVVLATLPITLALRPALARRANAAS